MQLTIRVILITLQLQGRGRRRELAAGAAAGAARASTTGELIRKTRLYTTGAEKRQTHCAIHHVGSLLPGDLLAFEPVHGTQPALLRGAVRPQRQTTRRPLVCR